MSIILIYFLIGISYVVINGALRKIETDDWMLTIVWLFLWPVCFLTLLIMYLNDYRNKM